MRTLIFLFLTFGTCIACSKNAETTETSSTTEVTEATTSPAPDTHPGEPLTAKRIVFFGNSLTAGYGLAEEQSFPSLIQNLINEKDYDYVAVNAGLSGETSAGGLGRIDWILKQPVDIFVLELGANDALRGFKLSETRKNLAAILEKVKTKYPKVQLVVAGMEAPPNFGTDYTEAFRNIFADLATQYDTEIIPFLLNGVAGHPDLNLPDGIHPTAEGQKIVRDNVWKVLEPLLQK